MPKLAIAKDKALLLTDETGLNPALEAFKGLYDDGSLAIMNSVGYPNPDRSHFRSMDIWHSASESNEYVNTGWLGRYLDAQCKGCDKPTQAMELDDVLSLALKGEENKYKVTSQQGGSKLKKYDHKAQKKQGSPRKGKN